MNFIYRIVKLKGCDHDGYLEFLVQRTKVKNSILIGALENTFDHTDLCCETEEKNTFHLNNSMFKSHVKC